MANPACNIDDRGVVLRLRRSVYAFGFALAIVALLQALEVGWPVYLVTVLPFMVAFSLAYQGLFKTCTYMASRGMRDLGEGHEAIANVDEAALLRRRGRFMNLLTASSAVAATALLILASR